MDDDLKKLFMVSTTQAAPPYHSPEVSWVSWLLGLASSIVMFFLALGLRDIKMKFDKVSELERKVMNFEAEIKMLKKEYRDE